MSNKKLLAEWMHDQYEEISKKKDWKTQEKCQVKFKDLPEENKKVMLELADRLLKQKDFKIVSYCCCVCSYEFENKADAVECCHGEEE